MKNKEVSVLEDYCLESGIYGIPAAAENFDENKYRYLRITDITDDGVLIITDAKSISDKDADKYLLSENDIVFARTGNSTGRTYFYDKRDGELVFAGFLIRYKLDADKINPKYLKYFTISKQYKHWVDNFSTGSTRGNMSAQDFAKMPLILPKRNQQDLLVKVMDALTDKISLNNRINTELEQMAKTIYDYWFVQFDFPDEEGKPYKTSGGEMEWNEELKREIPVGWEVKRLESIANTASGGTPLSTKTEYYLNGNIPWINSGELNNPFIVNTTNFITEKGFENSSAKLFPTGTILMAMYGATAGKVSVLNISASTNQAICAIIVKQEEYRNYLKFLLNDLYAYLVTLSSGSARDNLSQEKIRELFVTIPTPKLLDEFNKITIPIFDKIVLTLRETQELITLRDFLLPLLMNGQVKVK
jgi:type I restriction enzyme S subunit